MANLAVIDLGTNTFHLVIAQDMADDGPQILFRQRYYVKLARGGIEVIADEARTAALDACRQFKTQLTQWEVSVFRAIGTEALRKSKNALGLIQDMESILGFPITIIDGKTEARYIAQAISPYLTKEHNRCLIMDIGGGSVEFILLKNKEIQYFASFPIGVAVLRHQFHLADPISIEEQLRIEKHLTDQLGPFIQSLQEVGPFELIGAAGIYDVLARHLQMPGTSWFKHLDRPALERFIHEVISLPAQSILSHPHIPNERADLFPVAMVLIRWVLNNLQISHVKTSSTSMKEGVLMEMMQKQKI